MSYELSKEPTDLSSKIQQPPDLGPKTRYGKTPKLCSDCPFSTKLCFDGFFRAPAGRRDIRVCVCACVLERMRSSRQTNVVPRNQVVCVCVSVVCGAEKRVRFASSCARRVCGRRRGGGDVRGYREMLLDSQVAVQVVCGVGARGCAEDTVGCVFVSRCE